MNTSHTPRVALPEAAHLFDALGVIRDASARIEAISYSSVAGRAEIRPAAAIAQAMEVAAIALDHALIIAQVHGDDLEVGTARATYNRLRDEEAARNAGA